MLPEMQSVYHILTVHELQVRVNSMIQKKLYIDDEPEDLLDILELVEMRFTINGKSCKVFHAFPGDNPYGIFISEKETFEFGENKPIEDVKTKEGKSFLRWYYEITEDQTEYGKFQSFYMKLDD